MQKDWFAIFKVKVTAVKFFILHDDNLFQPVYTHTCLVTLKHFQGTGEGGERKRQRVMDPVLTFDFGLRFFV